MDRLISKLEARSLGLKRYFTGRSCSQGHIADRLVSNGGCVVCHKAGNDRRLKANPGLGIGYSRKYYLANKGKKAIYRLRWQRDNRDKVRAYCRAWSKVNHDYMVTKVRNRNAKKRGNGGKHTHQDILDLLALQWNKCAYFVHCGAILHRRNRHVDHIVPVSAGGSNGRENLQILCAYCNISKSNRDEAAYCEMIGIEPPKRAFAPSPVVITDY